MKLIKYKREQLSLNRQEFAMKRKIAKGYIDGYSKVKITPGYYQGRTDKWINGRVDMNINGKTYYFPVTETGSSLFPLSSDEYQKKLNRINSDALVPDVNQELLASPIWNLNGSFLLFSNTLLEKE